MIEFPPKQGQHMSQFQESLSTPIVEMRPETAVIHVANLGAAVPGP
jgi:hypothetical protein